MKCLRCGYCCIQYTVVIVDDPLKGLDEDNLIIKENGKRCQHLEGDAPGKFSCVIHQKHWYHETPCFAHCQIEIGDQPCSVGKWVLENKGGPVFAKLNEG